MRKQEAEEEEAAADEERRRLAEDLLRETAETTENDNVLAPVLEDLKALMELKPILHETVFIEFQRKMLARFQDQEEAGKGASSASSAAPNSTEET